MSHPPTMKILFLTLIKINSLEERGIYTDLLRKFWKEEHEIFIVCPLERRYKLKTSLIAEGGVSILQVETLNIQKTNVLEKGIGTIAIEYQYKKAIKKYFSDIKFDLVLYSTPPITLTKVISFIKKRDNAYSYLLLKDIFPQNAVDLGMIKNGGILHKLFQRKEKLLYKVSDYIGCMSPANVKYLLDNNPQISAEKVEVNPNTIEPVHLEYSKDQKDVIRNKYKVPLDKTVFVYGGNFGKPQGLDFFIEVIKETTYSDVFFLLAGDGTEYERIADWFLSNNPDNALLLKSLPKKDYDALLAACDVGLIFLHPDFTIPNFPSRLLSYLEMRMPVIAATDKNTDIGDIIENAECGFKVISGDLPAMFKAIDLCRDESRVKTMQKNAWALLQNEYTVEKSYKLIIDKLKPTHKT